MFFVCFCFVLHFPGIVFKKHMTEEWQAFFNDMCKVYLSAIQCLNSWSVVYFENCFCLFSLSYAWVLQDILGIAFCISLIRNIRLPNLKVCTILLVLLLIYDIFFVFITPLFSAGKSVMVEVATGTCLNHITLYRFCLCKIMQARGKSRDILLGWRGGGGSKLGLVRVRGLGLD